MMDLRTHLAECRFKLQVEKETRCAHEIPALLTLLEAQGRHDAVVFEHVLDARESRSAFRVVSNVFARADAIRDMLASAGMPDIDAFSERIAADGEWEVIERAPVHENVLQGDRIDLTRLPIVTHHERDAGPYLTAGIVIVRDPDSGVYNAAIQRLLVQSRESLGVFMVPIGHNKLIHVKYEARGEDMPVAVVVGHHPLFYFGAQTKEPIERDEYRISASLMGGRLRLTPCPTQRDFLVPADAELVIEGFIPAHRRKSEGPFAEYTHYYSDRAAREFITVTSVMHRNEPLLLDIFACHRDHHLLEGMLMTAQLTHLMKARYPEFLRLWLPLSGCCQFFCYMAVAQTPDTRVTDMGIAVLEAQEYIKYVVIVDHDIDVENEGEVLWAIATRATLSADLKLFNHLRGTLMDPTAKDADGPERGVIDATADAETLSNRVRVNPEVLARMNLHDYL